MPDYRECMFCEQVVPYLFRRGRTRRYCSDRCRKAAERARRRDPQAWERQQTARIRRERARQRRQSADRKTYLEGDEDWFQDFVSLPDVSGDRLFENPRIYKLMARALATDSEPEAAGCLRKARLLHRKQQPPVVGNSE